MSFEEHLEAVRRYMTAEAKVRELELQIEEIQKAWTHAVSDGVDITAKSQALLEGAIRGKTEKRICDVQVNCHGGKCGKLIPCEDHREHVKGPCWCSGVHTIY